MEKQNNFNWLEIIAFIIIVIGIVFAGFALYNFNNYYCFADSQHLDIEDSAGIASFIGNILSPLWALASVILFYVALRFQRQELNLQRGELKSTREEFEVNRITNVVFNQLDRIDKHIESLKIDSRLSYEALGYLHYKILPISKIENESDSEILNANYNATVNNIQLINKYLKDILILSTSLNLSFIAIKSLFKSSELNKSKLKSLGDLFFSNFGNDNIQTLIYLYYTIDSYSFWLKNRKTLPGANTREINKIKVNLKVIVHLYSQHFQSYINLN